MTRVSEKSIAWNEDRGNVLESVLRATWASDGRPEPPFAGCGRRTAIPARVLLIMDVGGRWRAVDACKRLIAMGVRMGRTWARDRHGSPIVVSVGFRPSVEQPEGPRTRPRGFLVYCRRLERFFRPVRSSPSRVPRCASPIEMYCGRLERFF